MENRNVLIVAATMTKATGTAERKAAGEMIVRHSPGANRITLGADKGYDAASFVAEMPALDVTPHIAQNISGPAFRLRCARHAASRLCGEPVEEEAHQGTVRLVPDDRRSYPPYAAGCQKARLQVHRARRTA